MGGLRKQPQGSFLQADTSGAEAITGGNAKLGADRRDHRPVLRGVSGGPQMKALRRFFLRLSWWATSARDEEGLRAEIEQHISIQTDENLRAGLSPGEARRQALLKFGNVEAIKE